MQSKARPVSFVQLMENVNKIPRQNILQLQRTRLFDYTTRTALPSAPPLPLPLLLLLLLLSWYIKSTRLHWSLNIKRQLGSHGRGEGEGEANLQHGCSRAKVLPSPRPAPAPAQLHQCGVAWAGFLVASRFVKMSRRFPASLLF